MLGQSVLVGSSSSLSSDRTFIYEVMGLHYNDQNSYPIRNSGSTSIQVAYNRMSEQMQRIHRLGGKIVSIRQLGTQENHDPAD
ncbi:MAG: phycobilisome linker polypeptide [Xenococcaceae cyanobacterium]